jgi:hypothetical protein
MQQQLAGTLLTRAIKVNHPGGQSEARICGHENPVAAREFWSARW